MPHVVSRQPGFDPRSVFVRFVVDRASLTGFSPSTSVFPCQYHSTNASYSTEYYSYGKDKRAKPGLVYFSSFRRHNFDPSYLELCCETS